MNKRTWTTYFTGAFTYDVADDQASAGGVHQHQIRKTRRGWQERIRQVNGVHVSYGPVKSIPEKSGEVTWAIAKVRHFFE